MEVVGSFKCLLAGDGGVGKTTFIKRLVDKRFKEKYDPTSGAEIWPLTFSTNIGLIKLDIWDTSGQGVR